jgi:hypothetical protein
MANCTWSSPPSDRHHDVALQLLRVLAPLAEARGLLIRYETGVFRPGAGKDWRVPDQSLFANRDGRMERVEPAEIRALAVRAETVDGKLRLAWEGGTTDI